MRLQNISILNFRSITSTEKLDLSNYCILIGKNNEGKTNVLHAINFSIIAMRQYVRNGRRPLERGYIFKRDYPISLIDNAHSKPTTFTLTFLLDENETIEFKKSVNLSNNGTISIQISFPKSERIVATPVITFKEKRGRGGASYKNHISEIISFLLNNFIFQYIPAVRTKEDSVEVLRALIRSELHTLEFDDDYLKAVNLIEEKRNHLTTELSKSVLSILKTFIPNINNVNIFLDSYRAEYVSSDNISFLIDDGSKTDIEYKGDGIKSLAAIALLYGTKTYRMSRIIAIEEPESHLHYEAIHQIENVLRELSEKCQVIITTHNPIFVNKSDIHSNIIVNNGIGKKAKSIEEIRKLLGIQIADSLYYADKVVIFEGEDDCTSIGHILCLLNKNIDLAIKNRRLLFISLGGSSNLKYKCSLFTKLLMDFCVLLDGDSAGQSAYNECILKGLVSEKNTFIPRAYGFNRECEFEDFISSNLYKNFIHTNYGVDLNNSKFKNSKKKWSERLKDIFLFNGKQFDKKVEEKIKSEISDLVKRESTIENILNSYGIQIFDNIAKQISAILLE